MRKQVHLWIGLLVLCLMLCGCGGEETDSSPPPAPSDTKQGPVRAELVIETSETHLMQEGERVEAVQFIESMLPAGADVVPLGYHAQIDLAFDREGQRLISITPTHPFKPDQAAIDEAAGELFALLKTEFDAYAKQALSDEFAIQQSRAATAAEEVKQLQQTLQTFQEARRGLPQTDASRLERRQLERQIETTLQAQIEANKRIKELQRRIDREQYVTLLRVR